MEDKKEKDEAEGKGGEEADGKGGKRQTQI